MGRIAFLLTALGLTVLALAAAVSPAARIAGAGL